MTDGLKQPINIEEQVTKEVDARDHLTGESTVSRYLQLSVPSITLDDENEIVTFVRNPNIVQGDTPDEDILNDLVKESVPTSSFTIDRNDEGTFDIREDVEIDEVEEPKLSFRYTENATTSTLGNYGKIHVKEDRGGNVFLFDFSDDNKRIFLKHDIGTYFNIDYEGNYTHKTVGSSIEIVTNHKKEAIAYDLVTTVKGEKRLNVALNDYQTYGGNQNISVGGHQVVSVGGNSALVVDGNNIQRVDGDDYQYTKGLKHLETGGLMIMQSGDTMVLRAPSISIETGFLKVETRAPYRENVTGERVISADVMSISGTNNLTLTTGGSFQQTVTGISREVIGGVAIPPSVTAKSIEIALGSYSVETTLGEINLKSMALGVSFGTLIAGLAINPLGNVDLENLLASLNLSITGEALLKGVMGQINVGLASTVIDHNVLVQLGGSGASEPVALGLQLLQWLNAHTHPTSVGPTLGPISPALPDLLSKKVMTA